MTRFVRLLPVLAFGLAAAITIAGGIAIDNSSLLQAPDSWGYAFASVVITLMYGLVPGLFLVFLAAVAFFADRPRPWSWAGAILAATLGLALALFSGWWAIQDRTEAAVAFAGVSLVAAAVLMAPAVLCALTEGRDARSGGGQSLRRRT